MKSFYLNVFHLLGVQHPVLACVERNSGKTLTDLYCSDIIGVGMELKRACNVEACSKRYLQFLVTHFHARLAVVELH